MLETVELKNFRCFKDHIINFDKFNVIVGKNNSGKSTIIDSLRLISNVVRYANFRNSYLKDEDIPFPTINLRYDYCDEETSIHAKFSDGTEIEVRFPVDGRPFADLLKNGQTIKNKSLREKILGVIPPVGSFEEDEKIRDRNYIRSVMVSHLTSRHFRNIWHFFPEGFDEFRDMVENTWPGYSIDKPKINYSENRINMYFTEERITREIFWAGHGFQIWLQLMTFLVKLGLRETLILDEPDIYLHQDLQKKLVNICKNRANQVIIATHAIDIIEEVEPEDIISIDKKSDISNRLSTIDEVQTCINQLGSYQNLKLVNFIRGKTCLFVEGKDFNNLKKIARKLNIDGFASEDGFSVIPLEGFSNWERLIHVDWIFKNTFNEKIKCYVMLDRDYYPDTILDKVINDLTNKNVKVHIWQKKELENYLIDPKPLYRMFSNRYSKRYPNSKMPLSEREFQEKLFSLFDALKEEVKAQIIVRAVENRTDKEIDQYSVFAEASKEFDVSWNDIEFRKKVIPGKRFFSIMNDWLNRDYKTSISIGYATTPYGPMK